MSVLPMTSLKQRKRFLTPRTNNQLKGILSELKAAHKMGVRIEPCAAIFQRMTIIIQSMSFRLLSKSTPIQTVSDFKGFAEAAGTLVGLLPNSKVRAPHY